MFIIRESANAKLVLAVNEANGSLTLSAELSSSLPIKAISWIHNGNEVQVAENPEKFYEDVSNPSHPFLVINDLEKMDVGSYALKAETDDKIWISDEVLFSLPCESTKISVLRAPDREDGSIVLQAKILTKWPIKRIRWQKNGTDLFISNIVMKYIENKSDKYNPSLTILNFENADEGKYSLISESVDGVVKSEDIEIKAPKVAKTKRVNNSD
ncbi:uncharacterized protein LOC133203989 [Saccostrea echinata]|uniref:uncharacterized protein LOC133203989 n=1 Tax=Saccostrea echinata TaxID=191078 RepID=UPI002A833B73|nr:uncharacterized protein LOC133203989 [Saccostrea echinata]